MTSVPYKFRDARHVEAGTCVQIFEAQWLLYVPPDLRGNCTFRSRTLFLGSI
jgi:hypothetical protein